MRCFVVPAGEFVLSTDMTDWLLMTESLADNMFMS